MAEAQVQRIIAELAVRRTLSADVMERVGGARVRAAVQSRSRAFCSNAASRATCERSPDAGGHQARLDRLDEAREIAQIGARIDRDFTYMLRAVGGIDDPATPVPRSTGSPTRTCSSPVAGSQGAIALSTRWSRSAAYESLLKGSRRAPAPPRGEILVAQPEPAAARPKSSPIISPSPPRRTRGRMGEQRRAIKPCAARHSREAIAHLGKAIAMADNAAGPTPRGRAFKGGGESAGQAARTTTAQAVLWSKGYAADRPRAAFERTSALAARALNFPSSSFSALFGRFLWSWSRGNSAWLGTLPSVFFERRKPRDALPGPRVAT